MIPKLALNFLVNKKDTTDFISLFDKMRANKVIYVEVILSGCETLDDVKKFIALFKTMRNKQHIDYTIWLSVDGDPFKTHDLFVAANKLDRLVMGMHSFTDYTDVPNLIVNSNPSIYPNVHDLMMYTDEQALKSSVKAIDFINAPEGMKRGLKRVIEDHVKMYSRAILEPHSAELSTASDQESE